MTQVEALNTLIQAHPLTIDANKISDGFHTFGELYDHRIELYIALCKMLDRHSSVSVWRTKKHSDGSAIDGWFVLGIFKEQQEQITYHLPISKWRDCDFAETMKQAPYWDGHTSADVLERLKRL